MLSNTEKDLAVSPTQKLLVVLQRCKPENMEFSPGLNDHVSGFSHTLLRTDRIMDLYREIHTWANLDRPGFLKPIPKNPVDKASSLSHYGH